MDTDLKKVILVRSDDMRIISQNSMIDVPYEVCAFSIGENINGFNIYARSKFLDEKPCLYATYKSEEKALKAMEMLREKYTYFCTAETPKYWFAFNNPKVFRFPQDDEIEV